MILDTPPKLTERGFQRQVIRLAKLFGWKAYHTHDSRHSPAGWPDLVLIRRPRVIFAELKTDRNHLTDDQRACLEELRACGQEAYEWHPRNWKSIERILAR
jgi:hypothetical protein